MSDAPQPSNRSTETVIRAQERIVGWTPGRSIPELKSLVIDAALQGAISYREARAVLEEYGLGDT